MYASTDFTYRAKKAATAQRRRTSRVPSTAYDAAKEVSPLQRLTAARDQISPCVGRISRYPRALRCGQLLQQESRAHGRVITVGRKIGKDKCIGELFLRIVGAEDVVQAQPSVRRAALGDHLFVLTQSIKLSNCLLANLRGLILGFIEARCRSLESSLRDLSRQEYPKNIYRS